jgi:TolB-like protein/cytochrome c-type biogenesis protein CcmH/NrfG
VGPKNFFAELKRRNVYKVAVAYAVVAWLLVQAASILFPTFESPAWIMKVFVVVILLGFPVALVIAWAFEMTPEGMKRTENISPNEVIPQWSRRKFAALMITLALVAAGLLAFQFLRPRSTEVVRTTTSSPTTSPTSPPIPEKSIAVLPFENLSDDKSNAYFADGIQDEILTRLSKIAALRVISRTSTQKCKSAPDNLREIGKQLGVANLLEGSVQKIGNAAHINVQLIRVATDEHLWAESYNRKLDDIFAVEGEVATAIADQLNAKLTGSEKESLAIKPTSNPQAYDAYLRGLAFQGRLDGLQTNIRKSIDAFEEAARLDPQFALAWAQLVRQDGLVYANFEGTPQRREAARQALDNAVRLAPNLAETQLAEGVYQYFFERNYEAAKSRYLAVRQRFPNNAFAAEYLGAVTRRQGAWGQSHQFYQEAIELDPQNVFLLGDAFLTDAGMRDIVSARKLLERARNLSPQNSTIIAMLATTYQMTGDIAQAQALLDGVAPADVYEWYVQVMSGNAILLHKYEPAIAMLKTQLSKPQSFGPSLDYAQGTLADLERHAGQMDAASHTYEQARISLEATLRQQPDNAGLTSSLAWIEACLGNQSKALDLARKAIALDPASKDGYTGPAHEDTLARIEAHFGDKDNAIAALQHLLTTAYEPLVVTPALLRIDPDWDNLRGDPRFEKLAAEPLRQTK